MHAAGSRSARPLTVEVTDETGRPVPGAAVSFHLPEEGPSGTFANGLRTEVVTADERGRARVRVTRWNGVGGRVQVRIVASKEQARAGIISFQNITGGESAAATAVSVRRDNGPTPRATHHRAWWIAVAVLAGGGAAAGLLAPRGGGPAAAAPGAVGVTAPAVSIGAPAVTVGKP